jgi:O-antigen/teichoic acid export membrane protein
MPLIRQAISGAKWTTLAAVITGILQLAQVAVLARFLTPSEFGLMGMLLVVAGFAQAYSDMGVSNAVIYRQETTPEQLSTLYWVNLAAGVIVFMLLNLSAPLVASFYKEPLLEKLMPVFAVSFLLSPFGQLHQALLQKQLRFKALALCEMASRTAGSVAAVLSAWKGFGIYALISAALFSAAVLSLTLTIAGWSVHRPKFHFRLADLKPFAQFGLYQMGERSINFLTGNLDKLLIGRILGAEALGLYNLAWNLVILPISRINPILNRIAFPVFAKLQADREALKRGYLRMMRILSSTNFALLFGLAALAPVLVPVIFGEGWQQAVPLVQILAFVSLFISVGNPVGSLLLAQGRADLGFKWNLALLLSQVIGIFLGAEFGRLNGVAVALLILHALYFLFSYPFLIATLLGPCWKEYVRSILPGFWTSFTMGLLVAALLYHLTQTHLDRRLLLGICTAVGSCYFALVTFATRRAELTEFLRSLSFSTARHG